MNDVAPSERMPFWRYRWLPREPKPPEPPPIRSEEEIKADAAMLLAEQLAAQRKRWGW